MALLSQVGPIGAPALHISHLDADHHHESPIPAVEQPQQHYGENYTPSLEHKMAEVESIRRALFNTQEKLLWEVLDQARGMIHPQVVRNKFLMGVFGGDFCQSAFMKYLVNLLVIHEALEYAQGKLKELDHLKAVVVPELFRSESIKKDLEQWTYLASKEYVPWKPYEGVVQYAQGIRDLVDKKDQNPEYVIAHMYVWLGTFMSGGTQSKKNVLKKMDVFKSYEDDLPPGSGNELFRLRYKEGDELTDTDVAVFKNEWHLRLSKVQDRLPAEKRMDLQGFQSRMAAEVTKGFTMLLEMVERNVEPKHC